MRDLHGPFAHRPGCRQYNRGSNLRYPTTKGANAVDRQVKDAGGDLRKERKMALPVVRHAACHRSARTTAASRCPPADSVHRAHAVSATTARTPQRKHTAQKGGIVATIVGHPRHCVIRKGVGRDKVPASHLRRVQRSLARDLVHPPFQDAGRLRPARATGGRRGRLIGIQADDIAGNSLHAIGAADQGRSARRHQRGYPRNKGADIGQGANVQPQQAAIVLECGFNVIELAAALRIGLPILAALLNPLDGPGIGQSQPGATRSSPSSAFFAPNAPPTAALWTCTRSGGRSSARLSVSRARKTACEDIQAASSPRRES